jgi:hypothetical protein
MVFCFSCSLARSEKCISKEEINSALGMRKETGVGREWGFVLALAVVAMSLTSWTSWFHEIATTTATVGKSIGSSHVDT